MFKRVGLFILTNILVIAVVSVIMSVFGIGDYTTANYGIDYTQLLLICGIWGMAGSFISLAMSKFMAKTMMGVKIVDDKPEYQALVSKVHLYAKTAGLSKMPEVGVYQSSDINAFATGPSKSNSLVAVSTGLLENMDNDEVDGVLAHEVAHIANGDMVTMALIQGIMNAFVMFAARVVAFMISNFMRGDDEEGQGLGGIAHFVVVMVLQIFFGILAGIVVNWFSRQREFRADAGAAAYAGPGKMIAALEALKRAYEHPQLAPAAPNENVKSMQISSKRSWSGLFSTHPSLDDRISALKGS